MAWAIGLGAFLVWGVLWLLEARWNSLPAYDRPSLTRSAAYSVWAGVLRKLLLGISLLGLAAVHWTAAAATATLLLIGWSVRRIQASAASQRRAMQKEFDRLRGENPDAPDTEILFQVVFARHARWGPDLVQQIVQENPTVEGAARMVVRMESQLRG
ncbi:MAG: hypothetical protein O7F16_10185 [Acidobacteria bacterium]|nr:hypothetical protein [Acidobacteriota bacterium]